MNEPTSSFGIHGRTRLRESTGQFSCRKTLDAQIWDRFASMVDFVSGSFEDASA